MRRYVLDNQHLHKRAEMLVQVQGDPDGTKHFEVVSEEGWKAANKHVCERCWHRNRRRRIPKLAPKLESIPKTTTFKMAGTEVIDGRAAYVLEVSPNAKRNTYFAAASGWTRRITRWPAQRPSCKEPFVLDEEHGLRPDLPEKWPSLVSPFDAKRH